MKTVIWNYVCAFGLVAGSVALATVTAHFVNGAQIPFFSEDVVRWMRIVNVSLVAAVTLGRSAWAVQTWAGQTGTEKWNNGVYSVLYLLSFILAVLSFLINPVTPS